MKDLAKTLAEYIREREKDIETISKSMQRGLKELLGAQTEEEVKTRIDYLIFLGKSLDALTKKYKAQVLVIEIKKDYLKKLV